MSGQGDHLREFATDGWRQEGHGFREFGRLILGDSIILITTQMKYEAYHQGNSKRFDTVPEAQYFCEGSRRSLSEIISSQKCVKTIPKTQSVREDSDHTVSDRLSSIFQRESRVTFPKG